MPSTLSSSIIFPCPHNTLCCFFSTTKRGYRFLLVVVVVDRKFTLGVLLGPKNQTKLLFRTSAFCTILGYPRLCNLLPATPKQTPPNTLLRKKEEIVRNFPSLVKNYELRQNPQSVRCDIYSPPPPPPCSHTLTSFFDSQTLHKIGPSKKNHFSACSSRPAAAFFH